MHTFYQFSGERYPGIATALHDLPHLVAGTFGVPLVEQVLHGNDVADSASCVDIVHDGDVANIQTDEIRFQELAHHKVVPAKAGVVFHDQIGYQPLFRSSMISMKGIPVVKEKPGIGQMIVLGVLLQNGLLILNTSGDTPFLVIP